MKEKLASVNLSALEAQNPWWVDGRVPLAMRDTVPRRLTPSVVAGLAPDRATVLLGPRRVGKTVLVHQVVRRLLEGGVAPRSIVYLSADDPLLGPTPTLFEELLVFVEERLLGGSGEPAYVLVDEVHVIADWPLWVKRSIDRGRPLVWLVTSSAGSILHRGSRESLAGRARDMRLLPFSLAEAAVLVRSPAAPLLERCAGVWESQGIGALVGERADAVGRLNDEALGLGDELTRLSRWYLRSGGFPEALAASPALSPREYFWQTLVERVLYVDVPAVARVRQAHVLRELCLRLLSQGPALINIERLASELGVTHVTVAEYLGIIERTMLDFILPRYATTLAGRQRGGKKSVPVDTGLVVALGGWDLGGAQGAALEGRLAEVVVHVWLRRHVATGDIMHWRAREGVEVDFVFAPHGGPVLPIEVKWGQSQRGRHRGLAEFQRRYGVAEALLVVREGFDAAAAQASLPLWMLA